ncbi:DUF1349 domain-containing protein [Microbispora hainanensis]|uniref:DUF1349 domain-containing protein n=2 Tax=Streptosporangiaceae TaxID=2004 RepID=A0ABZ1T514_9ACTN
MSGHGEYDNLFYVIEASYTDQGGDGGAKPLTGRGQVILQPKRKQAEHFSQTGRITGGLGTDAAGVQVEDTTDSAGGAKDIGYIQDGDYWSFDPVNLTNISAIRLRASSAGAGGTVQIRVGNPEDGTLIGEAEITPTGDWQTFKDVTVNLNNAPTTSGPIFFVVRKPSSAANDANLANFNWVDFIGKGATENQRPTVTASANPTTGTAPLKVDFTATGTDPEGDPVTYKWDFGVDGAQQATTANASYTYTAPGNYTATVTVTDAKGAATTQQIAIKVNTPATVCFSGRSDDFLGNQLDRDRWSVIRENQDLKVADGSLIIPTSATDIYQTTNNTPNIVVQPAPSGAWTATAKLTLVATSAYQQAGLVIYGDDDNYAKMVLQARSTSGSNHANRIFQFIREENGAPNEVSASNTATLGDTYPDTVYVRFVSDGTNITAHYSSDGTTFTAMPETKSLAGINNPRIGLISLAGANHPVVNAAFDWFQITPDDKATAPTPDDEFDGTTLDNCRWNAIVRPDATAVRVSDGKLQLDTTTGDIYGSTNGEPKNFILQTAPDGDWTLETKVDASALNEQYQQGGLMVYGDDDNYVKFDFLATNAAGSTVARTIELRSEVGGTVQNPQPQVNNLTTGVWWLRLKKEGDSFTGSYSSDGTTWTDLATNGTVAVVKNSAVANASKIGVYTIGTNQSASKTVTFDYFKLIKPQSDPEVKLTVTASSRCIGTSAYVAVTAVNDGDVPATIELNTPFGKKTVADVAPGKQAYQSFNTRAGQIDAGSVTVTGTATINGKQVTSSYDADYAAASCR